MARIIFFLTYQFSICYPTYRFVDARLSYWYQRMHVIVVPVPGASSTILTTYFIQHVLMRFDLCYLVVLDNGTPFKGSFIAMCEALNLNNNVLAKRNNEGFTVEYFHRFLNKCHHWYWRALLLMPFYPASITIYWTWNSTPIDGTNIFPNISAIGR